MTDNHDARTKGSKIYQDVWMHLQGVTSDQAVRPGVYLKTKLFPKADKYCQFSICRFSHGGSVSFTKARDVTLCDTSVDGAHIPRLCWTNDLEIILLKNYLELNYVLKRVMTQNVTICPDNYASTLIELILRDT